MMSEGLESAVNPLGPGVVIAGRYEIIEHLGTGGMGVVYRARDRQRQRFVALKTLRRDLDQERTLLVAKLLRSEADALRRVDSDFVVRIFDAHAGGAPPDGPMPFVVMELLRGRELERVLKEDGPMAPESALPLLWQAACGLKAIHAQNIVHRDIKPANLYLRNRDDGSHELKILDFSISRLLDQASGRKTTMIVGTRGYMAPEQAAGYDVDHRADLFALGQVAHTMLLGERGQEISETPKLPLAAFLGWHEKATASDRRERFGSATEAIAELSKVLGIPLAFAAASESGAVGLFETATTVLAGTPRRRPAIAAVALGLALVGGFAFWHQSTTAPHQVVAASRTAAPAVLTPAPAVLTPAPTVNAVASAATTATAAVLNVIVPPALPSTSRAPRMRAAAVREPRSATAPAPLHRPSDDF